jgi:hypothetical protein
MTAEAKMRRWVTVATIGLMAVGFTFLDDLNEWAEKPAVRIPLGIVTGAGLFELLTVIVEQFFEHVPLARRAILGKSFVEGEWVGGYKSPCGTPKLVIESLRQTWSSSSLNGQAFLPDGTPWGQWHSTVAEVEGEKGLLRATIIGDLESGHYDSILEHQIEGSPPNKISGLVADVGHAGTAWMVIKKVSTGLSHAAKLQTAKEVCREMGWTV